ncbi:EAL domain-containing protein [Microbacterium esteraromaticum]|uniref:EAL domain-containing protein n=1 Tax=Microbacterium esteraromaticum TaxID=57043 RepID=UPI0023680FAE|nr:EAL domain-containing protein [Microbacterium esteraromaticum]WDH79100.1 EAL domain-containing protein [Microbacterium esteraromaticum]
MISRGGPASEEVPVAHSAVFQPIVDLAEWRVVGCEALARFADGRSPVQHLDDAARRGEQTVLEIALIRTAVVAAAALPDDLFVTVNAAGATFRHPALPDVLAGLRRPWGLELTEGPTDVDLAEIRALVTDLGGMLLVDDAGTADADAARILAARPDIVKVDRAPFWEIVADANARARLEPALAAAREVGAPLVVEGISQPEHLDVARGLGARLGQGFHLGMPTPAPELGRELSELRRRIGVDAPGL